MSPENSSNSPDTPDKQSHPSAKEPDGRLKFWDNVSATYKYVRESVKAEGKRIRKSDPFTIWLVPSLAVVLAATSFAHGMLRTFVSFLALVSVFVYLLMRVGIMRSMNHRQVNIIWHMLMASFLGGMLLAIGIFSLLNP